MYNPFPILSPGLLSDQVTKGRRYFVRQTFPRGLQPGVKTSFLLRAYLPEERPLADEHLQQLHNDKHAFLYDAQDPAHLQKLRTAATQPTGYRIFYAAKKGVDWKPPPAYEEKMKEYIRRYHPSWRTKKGGDKIQIGLYEEFGELFLKFSYDKEHETVPLEVIERLT